MIMFMKVVKGLVVMFDSQRVSGNVYEGSQRVSCNVYEDSQKVNGNV